MMERELYELPAGAIAGAALLVIGVAAVLIRLQVLTSVTHYWPVLVIGAGIALLLHHVDDPRKH